MEKSSKPPPAAVRKSHDVPDYDALYKKFIVDLEMKKAQNRKSIDSKPFSLRAAARTRKPAEDKSNNNKKTLNRSNSSMARLSKSRFLTWTTIKQFNNESV